MVENNSRKWPLKQVVFTFLIYDQSAKRLFIPLRDDLSSGEVGPLDVEAAALQRLWQRVLQGDLCRQLTVLLWFPENLQRTASTLHEVTKAS